MALVRTLCSVAEARGARLSLRFRHRLVALSAGTGWLSELRARGHEVGAHAHGRGLSRVIHALEREGIPTTVAAPGLVQAGPNRPRLLAEAARLGVRLVTDHGPEPAFAYEGLVARREQGLVVQAPTVRPVDWGLYGRDGSRSPLNWAGTDRLRQLEQCAARHGALWFGLTVHEHDFCATGSLRPLPASLDAFGEYLGPRVVVSASTTPQIDPRVRADPRPPRLALPAPIARTVRAGALGVHRRLRARRMRTSGLPEGDLWVPVGHRRIAARIERPQQVQGICLFSHGGREGGRQQGLTPVGTPKVQLLAAGWAIWTYDRAGTGSSDVSGPLHPGNPAHDQDWQAMLARARQAGLPIVAVTWSAGLLAVLRSATAGHRPDALIDAEGPVDRWSLPPHGRPEAAEWPPDVWSDGPWRGLEAVSLLASAAVPYVRLQGERDHVHDGVTEHALRIARAAEAAGLLALPLALLPGRIHGNPDALLLGLEALRPLLVS